MFLHIVNIAHAPCRLVITSITVFKILSNNIFIISSILLTKQWLSKVSETCYLIEISLKLSDLVYILSDFTYT